MNLADFLGGRHIKLDQLVGVAANQQVSLRRDRQAFRWVRDVDKLADFDAILQTHFTNNGA